MQKLVRVSGTSIAFDDTRGCAQVTESWRVPGLVCLAIAAFSAYLLFLRPDIAGETTPLIWIFRVIFPFGFGWLGLGMVSRNAVTRFDAARGSFDCVKSEWFSTTRREGSFREIRRVTLDALFDVRARRPDQHGTRTNWKLTLALDLADGPLELATWRRVIAPLRPQNEAVVQARDASEKLAHRVGRPFVFLPEDCPLPPEGAP